MSTWTIDQGHSEIGFKVKHLMVSNVRGMFTAFSGTVTATDDTFADAKAAFEADTASLTTNNAPRDGHLHAPDMFDVAQFPKLTFASTTFTKTGDNTYTVVGNLTMKGVTKEVTLTAALNGLAKGMDGKRVASFDLSGKINRIDYGVAWNAPLETGGVVVSPEVMLELAIELKEE